MRISLPERKQTVTPMTDKLTELAKQGDWDRYEKAIARLWREYTREQATPAGQGTRSLTPVGIATRASMKAGGLLEPDLWFAAVEKAGHPTKLQATIRELLKLWLSVEVDPWGDGPA
jgi:hypothetical protein